MKKRSYNNLRDFFLVIFKHGTIIILSFLFALVCAIAVLIFLDPVYESSSKLLVKTPGTERGTTSSEHTEQTVDTAVTMLKGRFLAEKVIKKIGIQTIYPGVTGGIFSGKLSGLEKAVINFMEDLTVNRGTIIEVAFQHSVPSVAAEIVNKLVEEFLEYYSAVQKQNQEYNFFKEQVSLMLEKLQDSQKELGLFRNENKISSIEKQKSLLLLQISDLQVALSKTMADISEQEGLASSMKKSSQRADIQKKIISLQSKEKKLRQQITGDKLELGRLNKTETRLRELEREVKLDEENYLLYAKKMEEARISSAKDEHKIAGFSVIEPALPPIRPVKPDKLFIVVLAVIIGCIGGLFLVIVSEYFSHTFDTRSDIKDFLNFPEAAVFPEMTASARRMLTSFEIPDDVLEECNRIKHYIKGNVPDNKNKVLLFSSSNRREGTSTALLNFAFAMASNGESVLVIDADLKNPSLHTHLNVDQAIGLSEVITEKASVAEVIKSTQVASITAITSGRIEEKTFQHLQSQHFDSFLSEIRSKADWILFDSPSLDTCNDACIIAPKIDAVIMLLKAGKTRWEVAGNTVGRFKQCNVNQLVAILNRYKNIIPDWLYKKL